MYSKFNLHYGGNNERLIYVNVRSCLMRCEYFIGKFGLFDTSLGQEYDHKTEGGLLQGDNFSLFSFI